MDSCKCSTDTREGRKKGGRETKNKWNKSKIVDFNQISSMITVSVNDLLISGKRQRLSDLI